MTTRPRAGGWTRGRSQATIASFVIGAGIGLAAGSWIHYQRSLAGLGGVLGTAVGGAGILSLLGAAVAIALVAAILRRRAIVTASAAFAIGVVVGGLAGSTTGPTFHPAVAGPGTATVVLTQPAALEWRGDATCTTIENGAAIVTVRAPTLTRLGGQVVWLTLTIGDGAAVASELSIGQPLDPDASPPYPYRAYSAAEPALTSEVTGADRRAGTIRFADLVLTEGPVLPLDPPAAHLAGRAEWSCEPAAG
jgi:hypothetical protein